MRTEDEILWAQRRLKMTLVYSNPSITTTTIPSSLKSVGTLSAIGSPGKVSIDRLTLS
jgi:hypothetical protein